MSSDTTTPPPDQRDAKADLAVCDTAETTHSKSCRWATRPVGLQGVEARDCTCGIGGKRRTAWNLLSAECVEWIRHWIARATAAEQEAAELRARLAAAERERDEAKKEAAELKAALVESVKPPLGVMPRTVWDWMYPVPTADQTADREAHVRAGIERYRQAGKAIPARWLEELGEVDEPAITKGTGTNTPGEGEGR